MGFHYYTKKIDKEEMSKKCRVNFFAFYSLYHHTKKIDQEKRSRKCSVPFFKILIFLVFFSSFKFFKFSFLFSQLISLYKKKMKKKERGSYCIPQLTVVRWGGQPGSYCIPQPTLVR